MDQIPTYIEDILTALLSGAASDAEVKILREWLDMSPEHGKLLTEYREMNFIMKSYRRDGTYNVDEAWARVSRAIRKNPSGSIRRLVWRLPRYAAVFILAFGAGLAAMHFQTRRGNAETEEKEIRYTEYTVPYAAKSMIILPDSSTIWMNAGSRLRYSSDFNSADREVFIEGEAYFNVAKNADRPFYVKTSAVTLKVLGTSFNIKAYPEENSVETTVESGSVQVLRNVEGRLSDRLILTAGQKATIIKSAANINSIMTDPLPLPAAMSPKSVMPKETAEKTIVTKNVVTELYTSWKDARWLIEKETLEALAVKLERRYNIHVSFADESLKRISFSGTLKDETLEQVLEAIKLSAPVNYTVRQNRVILSTNRWLRANHDRNN
ncbi:MAG: FecR domain-containing protein [Tannerella sp.]|nr:FecR domain-containing protein [Tannerella sp.]